jgi:hypothetical protein
VQLTLNFRPTPQPVSPVTRLTAEQRAELVTVLARIITKAAGKAPAPANAPAIALPAGKEPSHD